MTSIKTQQPNFTVCIPTYYGGPSLVRAVESIRRSRDVGPFRIIVAIDGNPLAEDITRQLEELDVEIVFSAKRGGQVARIKQMVAMVDTELTVLTQDDINFDKEALGLIISALADKKVTMIGVRVVSVKATTFFESIIAVGVRLTRQIGQQWRVADNFLLASGRCLAFRTNTIKKFELPDEVINSDALMYFENRRLKGVFRYVDEAIVYNRSPLHLKEHVKQAKKFEYSQMELTRYFSAEIAKEYEVPFTGIVRAVLAEFWCHPFAMLLYCSIHIYTKWQKNEFTGSKSGFWETDVSTKRVK